MRAGRAARIIVALLASLSLASCADSGGGIGGTGFVSNGTITAFGSIVVNGVEFDTANAEVIIGGRLKGTGNQAVLDNLDIGQTVVVEGTENDDGLSGTATRVRFTPQVKGPVTEILDSANGTKRIVVLGRTIITDAKTVFKNPTIGDLTPGNLIEVSGVVENVADAIRATHVRKIADSFEPFSEVEIKGIIRDLDSSARTFSLNVFRVTYRSAETGSLPEGRPRTGQFVHVKGKASTGFILVATEIELAEETRIANADRVVLEGFITDFVSTFDFMVGHAQVQTRADTQFVGGQREELATGARIRVRGGLVNGILQAQRILFRQ